MIMTTNKIIAEIKYPISKKETVIDNYFGENVSDPFRWLEDDKSEATTNWVKAQNVVTAHYLSAIPYNEQLKTRLTQLTNYTKYGVPIKNNGKYYYFKNDGLQNQSILYCKKTLQADEELVLDPNKLSTNGTVALTAVAFSKDGKYLAYSISHNGSDWNEILVMDIEKKATLPDHVLWCKFSNIAWAGNGFYYSAYDAPSQEKEYTDKNKFHKIFYHSLGTPQSADKLIFMNKDYPQRNYHAEVTADEKFLCISESESTSGNALYIKYLSSNDSSFITLASGFDFEYNVIEHDHQQLYVLTNWNAPNQKLVRIDPKNPQQNNWQDVLPEKNEVLESVSIINGKIVATYLKNACHQLFTYDMQGNQQAEIQLPTKGSISSVRGTKNDQEAFYEFTSYIFPPTIFKLDVSKNAADQFLKSPTLFQPSDFITEQLFYTSKDGTKIPITLCYKKGIVKNGKNPTMLYGYGGFNISLKPGFSTAYIPFLENGGIYAVANIRGGGEYGEAWHKAGTKMQKQNVFDDFVSAAEFLISEKYTCSQKLAINGRSNGGLLIGACLTQHPELFAVAIPEVGVLDMLRYQHFTIGWAWASDYGTSADSKEMYSYLKNYSPLHNIHKTAKYPAVMILTGDHDDRVVPAHSFKFAATLQTQNTPNTPKLIRIDTNAGHGMGKPISKILDAQADLWSFVMWNLQMSPKFEIK